MTVRSPALRLHGDTLVAPGSSTSPSTSGPARGRPRSSGRCSGARRDRLSRRAHRARRRRRPARTRPGRGAAAERRVRGVLAARACAAPAARCLRPSRLHRAGGGASRGPAPRSSACSASRHTWRLDPADGAGRDAELVVLGNPDNPTGTLERPSRSLPLHVRAARRRRRVVHGVRARASAKACRPTRSRRRRRPQPDEALVARRHPRRLPARAAELVSRSSRLTASRGASTRSRARRSPSAPGPRDAGAVAAEVGAERVTPRATLSRSFRSSSASGPQLANFLLLRVEDGPASCRSLQPWHLGPPVPSLSRGSAPTTFASRSGAAPTTSGSSPRSGDCRLMALVLLVGGARSGKSSLAVRLAGSTACRSSSSPPARRATTRDGRADRAAPRRAARRRGRRSRSRCDCASRSRPRRPRAASSSTACRSGSRTCSNAASDVEERRPRQPRSPRTASAPTIAVTNEVGLGVVPATPLGRAYRDVLGRVNAIWAEAADESYFVVAGRSCARAACWPMLLDVDAPDEQRAAPALRPQDEAARQPRPARGARRAHRGARGRGRPAAARSGDRRRRGRPRRRRRGRQRLPAGGDGADGRQLRRRRRRDQRARAGGGRAGSSSSTPASPCRATTRTCARFASAPGTANIARGPAMNARSRRPQSRPAPRSRRELVARRGRADRDRRDGHRQHDLGQRPLRRRSSLPSRPPSAAAGTGLDDDGLAAQGRRRRAGARGEPRRPGRRARRARGARRLRDRAPDGRHPRLRRASASRSCSTASSPARRRSSRRGSRRVGRRDDRVAPLARARARARPRRARARAAARPAPAARRGQRRRARAADRRAARSPC